MTSHPTSQTPGKAAGARQWLGLALLLLPVALMTADLGVLWLATPYLTADLRPSSAEVLWITDIYGFLTAGTLVIMGTLGDRIGRRKLLMAGSAGFVLASLVAAYAPNPEVLIGARAVLGVAGAAVLPSTLALISHMFTDPRQRATAIAMWVTALSVGLAVGPVIGGVMLASWWWGSVFLMGVPVMLLALATAPALLPEYRDPTPGRLDLVSVALFLLAVLPVVYAVKSLASAASPWEPAVAFMTGMISTVAFIRRQNQLATPLLDLRLFSDRAFTGALLTLLLGMTALNGVEYLVPQYLQAVAGQSPLEAGLWLLPGAAGLIAGSQLTPVLARRFRPAYVLIGGLLLSLTGYASIALADGVVTASLGLTVIMFGVAPISVLGTALAVGSAPAEKAGAAAATGQTAYDLGLALGIAVTGTLAAAVYRGEMPDQAPAAAKDTVGAAIATAERLPNGDALISTAKAAFTAGLQTAATASAAFALATAALVATLLRHVPPIGATAPATAEPQPDAEAPQPVTSTT
ncbi:MFS transporter [Streptomyces lancefieldiae]|uniref:MFS transporter n=1 Tax=Streptomyces lancefieldiae TaxID=3075520 RepID=A0ABU3AMF9_9ACTN|nr:MFS transporter [Streptomyces sp. DSM 40712]MDT0611055.1 MFS transporter [Streptomyces sp. DSM 40712]